MRGSKLAPEDEVAGETRYEPGVEMEGCWEIYSGMSDLRDEIWAASE